MDGKNTPPPGGAHLLRGNIAIPRELHIYFHVQGENSEAEMTASDITGTKSSQSTAHRASEPVSVSRHSADRLLNLLGRASLDRSIEEEAASEQEQEKEKEKEKEQEKSTRARENMAPLFEPLPREHMAPLFDDSEKEGSTGKQFRKANAARPDSDSNSNLDSNFDSKSLSQSDSAPNIADEKKAEQEQNKDKNRSQSEELFSSANGQEDSPQKGAQDAVEDNLSWTEEAPEKIHAFSNAQTVIATLFGVLGPALVLSGYLLVCAKRATLQALAFPVESFVQLLLMALIPVVNYKLNLFVARKNTYLPPLSAALAGIALAAAMAVSVVCVAIDYFAGGAFAGQAYAHSASTLETSASMLGMSFFASALTTVFLLGSIIASKESDSLRRNVYKPALVGALASTMLFVSCQARSFYIKYVERTAVQAKGEERASALSNLRGLDGERLIKMECADSRAAGLAGVFFPIKQSDSYRLFFALSGKPFRGDNDHEFGVMPDEYLSRHLVGSKVDGLSLTRSAMNAEVNSDSLIANVGWTFVFKNSANAAGTARGEFALPPGAVVTGLKVWRDGEAIPAVFASSNLRMQPQSTVAGFSCNTVLTDLGRDRYLLRCMDLSPENEMKVEMNMEIPLKMVALDNANLILPRFSSTNFSMDGEHALKLIGNHKLFSSLKELSASMQDGKFSLSGSVAGDRLTTPLSLSCARSSTTESVYAPAGNIQAINQARTCLGFMHPNDYSKPLFVARKIEAKTAKRPGRLIVVIDGSKQTADHIAAIKESLSKIPAGIPVSVMVASQESKALSEPTQLKEAMPLLDKISFVGGQDNLRSLVKASEFAGQTIDGVVVWLHGSQPALNPEIYIMSPFAHKPALYEFAYDAADGGVEDFFNNHREISQFMPVPRAADAASDLTSFFSRWQAGRSDYAVSYVVTEKPQGVLLSGTEAQALRSLQEFSLFNLLLKSKQVAAAGQLAVDSHLVSRYSAAVLYQSNEPAKTGSAPALQGATNGTIAQQDVETIVQGVNTAGTVRVNNLANLEALLNIIANSIEILGISMGGVMMINSFIAQSGTLSYFNLKLTKSQVFCLGLVFALAALSVPGTINWFVASARDAALFD